MLGSLAVVPLPDGNPQWLQDSLLERYQIEVPIVPYPTPCSRLVRISAQLYNRLEQYDFLATAIAALLHEEKNQIVKR
jgi:isopenicillin-N epimerase